MQSFFTGVICKEVVNKQELMLMKISSLMVNVAVLVLLSPQQTLDLSSNSAIQRTVQAAAPWFQVVAASFTIVKHGTELFEKKDKTGKSDDD